MSKASACTGCQKSSSFANSQPCINLQSNTQVTMNHFYTDIYAHHQLFRRPVLLGFYNDVMHFVAVLFLLLACPDVQGTSAKTGNSLIKMIAFRSVKTKTKSKVNLELKQLYKVSSIMHIFEFANTSVVHCN